MLFLTSCSSQQDLLGETTDGQGCSDWFLDQLVVLLGAGV